MKHRRARTAKERDSYAAARIEQILDAAREGEIELSQPRLKAIEIAYSRLKPTLAAVEQTITDPRDKADPAQIEAQLRAMYDAHPELFAFIQAKAPQQSSEEPVEPHTTH